MADLQLHEKKFLIPYAQLSALSPGRYIPMQFRDRFFFEHGSHSVFLERPDEHTVLVHGSEEGEGRMRQGDTLVYQHGRIFVIPDASRVKDPVRRILFRTPLQRSILDFSDEPVRFAFGAYVNEPIPRFTSADGTVIAGAGYSVDEWVSIATGHRAPEIEPDGEAEPANISRKSGTRMYRQMYTVRHGDAVVVARRPHGPGERENKGLIRSIIVRRDADRLKVAAWLENELRRLGCRFDFAGMEPTTLVPEREITDDANTDRRIERILTSHGIDRKEIAIVNEATGFKLKENEAFIAEGSPSVSMEKGDRITDGGDVVLVYDSTAPTMGEAVKLIVSRGWGGTRIADWLEATALPALAAQGIASAPAAAPAAN